MRILITAGILLLVTLPSHALADYLYVGMQLPAASILNKGELKITEHDISYEPWHSRSLSGQKVILQYLPATLAGSRANIPLIDRLYELEHPHSCRTINIVNIAASMAGTAFIAEHELKRHKKRTPLCTIIQDQLGELKDRWSLPEKTATTLVINERGVIEFLHSGSLTPQLVDRIILLSNP